MFRHIGLPCHAQPAQTPPGPRRLLATVDNTGSSPQPMPVVGCTRCGTGTFATRPWAEFACSLAVVLDMHHLKVVPVLVALRTAVETDAQVGGVGHLVFADEVQNIRVVSGHDKARTRVEG